MAEATDEDKKGARVDWQATLAGAGAAVTVAVLLSTLGAAGTLIGAALGSVIATVSTTLYKQGIESSRRRMAEMQTVALRRVNLADQSVRRAADHHDPAAADRALDQAHEHLEAAGEELAETEPDGESDAVAEPEPGRSRWAELSWKRIAMLAAVVFVIALLVIGAFELIAGRSVSTITGGTDGKDRTSFSGVFGGSGGSGGKDDPTPAPREEEPAEETPTPTPTPTDAATTTPAETPSETSTPPETASPSESATVTDTVTESVTPSASPSPSASPTP